VFAALIVGPVPRAAGPKHRGDKLPAGRTCKRFSNFRIHIIPPSVFG
jgi:hypothetical protein